MERRKFLKLSSGTAIGLGININGISGNFLDWLSPATTCNDVSERILVIVRMAGANDGLNTLVPLNQYGAYETLRPTTKLATSGANSLLNLDGTLPLNNQLGLHPSMTGFKNLYDAGKLRIIHSVGYPNPNYSHFVAENIMFSGKDGNSFNNIKTGLFGRYLDTIYPGLSGNPQIMMPDPLALHFGSSNSVLGLDHDHGTAEYNMTSIATSLYGQLTPMTNSIPNVSEYYDNINYIKFLENGIDAYYDRIQSVFSAGFNSSASYPNTDLARQLKTIARLVKGGSKTKIFQTTLGGFDTHANQVVSGASHTGNHATLLANVSGSISSFMNDMAALGLEDKVMVVSFSEFGRKARENGSLGTDHGDIAPMFVIGKHVVPGVLGTPPNLTNVYGGSDGRFFASERQFDYRQVYTTLLQDWLGASDSVLNNAELNDFQTQKLDLVKTTHNAYPSCLSSYAIDCTIDTTVSNNANIVFEINGWSYYSFANSLEDYVFAIEKKPIGVGSNTNDFEVEVEISEMLCSNTYTNYMKHSGSEATVAAGQFFNIDVVSIQKPNGSVNIRWFLNPLKITDLTNGAAALQTTIGATTNSPILFLKKNNTKLNLPKNLREDGLGLHYAVTPLVLAATGTEFGKSYHQFDNVLNIDKTGAGAFKRLSNLPFNAPVYNYTTQPPIPNQKGSIHFNTFSKTFEGYDGTNWVPLH